jgi:hypothetical protein
MALQPYLKEYYSPWATGVVWTKGGVGGNDPDRPWLTNRDIDVRNLGATLGYKAHGKGEQTMYAPYRDVEPALYNTYAGTDIVAELVFPNGEVLTLAELQTISYSTHRENTPVRTLGHVAPRGFVKGPRTLAGSLIFTVFNYYAFYKVKQFQTAIGAGLYPLSDMLPPFDVVITFVNEVGAMSKMKLYGVTIVDEGQTMSVDDLITEQTYSYMARGIQPMTAFVVNEYAPESNSIVRNADTSTMEFNK